MDSSDVANLFGLAGGIGLFLLGTQRMSEGMQKMAGKKTRSILDSLTKNIWRGVLAGAGLTALIQSSSAATVIVIGLVNAGLLTLEKACGVIMGANIGTTITAWLVSMTEWAEFFNPEFFAPLLTGIGAFVLLLSHSDRSRNVGVILVGFGLLFMGLSLMSDSIAPYKDSPVIVEAFQIMGGNPLLAILAGMVVTALIQSSSASIGILQTMAMQGIVNWGAAVYIIMGCNIGTCITSVLSSTGGCTNAKRTAAIHVMFNVAGTVVFGLLGLLVFSMNPDLGMTTVHSTQLATFHTIFNLATTAMLIPFNQKIVDLSRRIVPEPKNQVQVARGLDERVLESPLVALETLRAKMNDMTKLTMENYDSTCGAFLDKDVETANKAFEKRKTIRQYYKDIAGYVVELDLGDLGDRISLEVNDLLYMSSDLERVNARLENLAEMTGQMAQENLAFSSGAKKDMEQMIGQTRRSLSLAVEAKRNPSLEKVQEVRESEKKVDALEAELRDKHIHRLEEGKCSARTGVIFLETLSNLERISDHAENIADYTEKEWKAR